MKFTQAWAQVAKQNVNLKVALLTLAVCTLFLGFSLVKLSLAEPLVIERGCYSKSLDLASAKATRQEMITFVELALRQRLNSNTMPIEGFLTPEELKSRESEQRLLSEKDITQTVVVQNTSFNDNKIVVDLDRLYSVKNVRSAFPTKLLIKLESKPRTETNPYGLILTKIEEIKPKKKGDK
ncbi:MAG: hypothetical protein H6626_05255 [Pseudobdellovibrionaceae bacterium]|nr:MAG: hypothetical protein H6626_05255 [Pseudobdellovibrionaceae bacterium]